MQKQLITGAILALIAYVSIYVHQYSSEQNLSVTKTQPGGSLNFMLIGDVGAGNEGQKIVAERMNVVAGQKQSEFVLNAGDNFYIKGVSGLDDPLWNTAYADIYPTMSNLKGLPWLGVLGNHDYYGGLGVYSQFEYRENNFYIEDFFWSHTNLVGDKKVAFIHVDTSFLAYWNRPALLAAGMKKVFEKQGWTSDEDILALVEEQLLLYKDYDYVFAMGHHHIGYSCWSEGDLYKLYDLLQKHKVSGYFNGHSHTLAYKVQDEMGMLVSGCGSLQRFNECEVDADPSWSIGHVRGFMNIEIYEDEVEVVAHYIDQDYEEGWKQHSLPSIKRRERN